jgi:transcriptional regulator NrdR family protein
VTDAAKHKTTDKRRECSCTTSNHYSTAEILEEETMMIIGTDVSRQAQHHNHPTRR